MPINFSLMASSRWKEPVEQPHRRVVAAHAGSDFQDRAVLGH